MLLRFFLTLCMSKIFPNMALRCLRHAQPRQSLNSNTVSTFLGVLVLHFYIQLTGVCMELKYLLPQQEMIGAILLSWVVGGVQRRVAEVLVSVTAWDDQPVPCIRRVSVVRVGESEVSPCGGFVNVNSSYETHVPGVTLWNTWRVEKFNFNLSPFKKIFFQPVTIGALFSTFWARIVNRTPALVPTHTISVEAISEVTRRHAALCCWMMLSQLLSILFTAGATFTSQTILKLKKNL